MNKAILTLTLLLMASPLVSAEEIESCQGLQTIEEDLDAEYRLTQDIDCSNVENFDPIGDYSADVEVENSFEGTFDGQGYTIQNLRIERPEDSQVGLFSGLLEGAEVKDVKIENSRVIGDVDVAGIVGRNDDGTIRRVSFDGEIEGNQNVGGIIGWNRGILGQSFSNGTVQGEGQVGGVVGRNFAASIVAVYSTAEVTGDVKVGGVVGENLGTSSTVEEVFAAGNVEGSQETGGALGHDNSYGTTSFYWDRQVTGQEESAKNNEWTENGALETVQMTGTEARENMEGLEFETTWGVPEDGNYPYLKAIQNSGIEAPSNTEPETCTYDFFGEVQDYTYETDGVTGEVHIGDGMTQVTSEGSFGFTKTAECGSTVTAEYREDGELLGSAQVELPEESGDVSDIAIDAENSEDRGETIEVELNPRQYGERGIATIGLPINGEIPLSQLSDDCPIVGDQVFGYESGGTETDTLNGMRGYAVITENTQSCTATVQRSAVSGNLDFELPNNEWVVFSVPDEMNMDNLNPGQECTLNGIGNTKIWEITGEGNQALDQGTMLRPNGIYWIRAQGSNCQIGSEEVFETPE